MTRADQWNGYYRYYLAEARRRGVSPLEVLDEQWQEGRRAAEYLLPYLTTESVALEIACGIGRVSRFVAPRCRWLTCTDILPEALAEIRNQLRNASNVSFRQTSGYDLRDFPDAGFDCVYSFAAFFHFDFELVVTYFGEIARVLKPGGIGVIGFKGCSNRGNLLQLLEKIERRGGIESYGSEIDKWRYVSKEMLATLCEYYALAVIDEDVTRYTFRKAPN